MYVDCLYGQALPVVFASQGRRAFLRRPAHFPGRELNQRSPRLLRTTAKYFGKLLRFRYLLVYFLGKVFIRLSKYTVRHNVNLPRGE